MKKFLFAVLVLSFLSAFPQTTFAYRRGSHPSRDSNYTHDAYGHLTRRDNLWNDTDGDGVSNYYDRSDRNASRW